MPLASVDPLATYFSNRVGGLNRNRCLSIGEGRKGGGKVLRAAGEVVEKFTEPHVGFLKHGPWGK